MIIRSLKLSRHDQVKLALSRKLKGEVEVRCKFGRIDVLTKSEAIEVKKMSGWKHALGQALVYGEATNKIPRVHLYGKDRLPLDIEDVIIKLGARLSYDFDVDSKNKI